MTLIECMTLKNVLFNPLENNRFYARLTELRNRIKSGSQLQHQHSSMPILHDDDKDQEQQQQQQSTTTTTKSALTKTTSLAPSTYSSLPRSLRGSTAKDQQQQQHLPSLPESAPLTRSISLRDDDSSCDINKRTSPLITDLMTTTTTATAATATNLPAKPPTNLDIWYGNKHAMQRGRPILVATFNRYFSHVRSLNRRYYNAVDIG